MGLRGSTGIWYMDAEFTGLRGWRGSALAVEFHPCMSCIFIGLKIRARIFRMGDYIGGM